MRSLLLLSLCALGAYANSAPGDLIGIEEVGTVTASQAGKELKDHFRRVRAMPAPLTGVRYYRIRYRSLDLEGKETTLSGLVGLPLSRQTKGLTVYCHGTVADREFVPSRWKAEGQFKTEWGWANLALAHGNYAVAMPDYLGLGDHEGIHPYAVKENVRSVEDIVAAARTLGAQKGSSFANRLHIAGYSEGGGIAMWAARLLGAHKNPRMRPDSTAPMAGPYDLSDTTAKDLARSSKSLSSTAIRAYFMAYFGYSAKANFRGPELEALFVPSFASYIPTAFERPGSDFMVLERLTKKMVQVGGIGGIGRILQPGMRDDLNRRNMENPILRLLAENDCYDWTPNRPLFLTSLKTDETVPSANTAKAVATMRRRGVPPNILGSYSVTVGKLSHMTAVPNCLAWARVFFDGGHALVRSKARR